ncbi:CocE/NonD family hydrolase [Actinomadura macrotermitis]|uniref:Cocaine esterase n=1 Tax=Actinomadura macrotermitis TaxID=2585200 RepID=A0A7K0BXB3_9ACTN|nr:CocE/NonD family hydrolase [Actinomadura macrotermitis]MQY05809.1 Cocaine esterase [Actinomadura macrotermitis]
MAPRSMKPPRSVRLARRTLRGLPAARYGAGHEAGLRVPAADGSPLLTDHYFPLAEGDFPTLLMRSSYGRGFPWAALYGMAFAEQGFHVVLQSCRGTGGSGGDFHLWRNEPEDGRAAVAWLREQPWFNGVLGTIGPSYLAYTQWALASDPPPELRAIVAQVPFHDPHAVFYSGGVLNLENALAASAAMAFQGRGTLPYLKAVLRLACRLKKAARTRPLTDGLRVAFAEPVPFLEEALAHPDSADPFWQGAALGPADVPACLITGWYDLCLEQTLRQYARLPRASLLVGPWTHTSALDKGAADVFAESLAWLRAHLCGDDSGLRKEPVRVFVDGEPRDLPSWPPPGTPREWRLGTDLVGPDALPLSFRHDPADPTPSIGGPLLSPKAGRRDDTALAARADTLTFDSGPLTEPLEIIGPVAARLSVTTATGHGDVFARLCDVDTKGRSRNICDGVLRLTPDAPETVTVAMGATAHRFPAGHRVRLLIAGGAHPRFACNPGTGEPAHTAVRTVPVDFTVYDPSALVMPG